MLDHRRFYGYSNQLMTSTSLHEFEPRKKLQLWENSFDSLKALVGSPHTHIVSLYSAKTSGSTGKALYRRLGGKGDIDNFINNPLASKVFGQKQKFVASHYTCAKEQVARLLSLSDHNQLIIFPFRESTSLIRSAALESLHWFCDQPQHQLKKNGTCTVTKDIFLQEVLGKKLREMSWTHLDCLDFSKLRDLMYVSRARVCFASMLMVDGLNRVIAESEGIELPAPENKNEDKDPMFVEIPSQPSVIEAGHFLDANWPKIIAGLDYIVSPEHRWLENEMIKLPNVFLCNRPEEGT